jgi:pimeloyl-ACP methyl ester carboxylesterase
MSAPAARLADLGDQRLEVRWLGPGPDAAPTLVLLHEGLGSAHSWGAFPESLAAATGCGVVAYSRAGYGQSSPVPLPRPLTYMHDEASDVLPRLLDGIGFRDGVLIGHSDGASIATIFAGTRQDPRVRGLVLMAPHFFVEDVTVAAIAAAQEAYATGDLRARLARWHAHVDVAFRGWNEAWLDPRFRAWDIREDLARVRVPILLIQGADDQYGTLEQVRSAETACICRLTTAVLPGVRHTPHREAAKATLAAIAAFMRDVLGDR